MLAIANPIVIQFLVGLISLTGLLWLCSRLHDYLHEKQLRQKSVVDQINRILPQTQCGQCGHKGCRPYAQAMAKGEAINKCPPGGVETIAELSVLLHEIRLSLNPAHGSIRPFAVAVIREDECIGCTKCIQACPVDAILGGAKLMHTVIEKECTGCDLCVEPCPVDCIDMICVEGEEEFAGKLPNDTSLDQRLSDAVL